MEQNQNAHGASAADGSHKPAALPHFPGASWTATPDTPAPPGDDPDFASDEEATAYWQGVADGIHQSGGIVPPRLAARAAGGDLLVPVHGEEEGPPPAPPRNRGGESDPSDHELHDSPPAFAGGAGGDSYSPPSSSPAPTQDPDDILAFTPTNLRARHDGWTPEKQVAFVEALADTGIIRAAAARVKMTPQSVSRLRRRKDARAFDLACRAAEQIGRRAIVSTAWERAIEGTIRRHYFHGELKSEERVFNDRLLIALLNRLPPDPAEDKQIEAVEQDWDGWMDAIAEGRDAPAAPDPDPTPPAEPEDAKVWEDEGELFTNAPPPEGFDGSEDGEYGQPIYQRALTQAEEDYWRAGGEEAANERRGWLGPEWHLGRQTIFPWGCEPSALFAEPEAERSEASETSGERRIVPADGSSPDEPDRRHGFAGTPAFAPVAEPQDEASEADLACGESRPSAADGSPEGEPDRRHAEEAERQGERSEASEACRESLTRPADGSSPDEPDRRHGFAGTPSSDAPSSFPPEDASPRP